MPFLTKWGTPLLLGPGTIHVAHTDHEHVAIADLERYYVSSDLGARDRVKLMRLAWDFIGSEFGNRHQQYEKFYGGASYLVKTNMYRNYDFRRAADLVDAALGLPPFGE